MIRTLYAQAPHATLHAPFCVLRHLLARCQYRVSTDGQRLSAVVGYTENSIEFTWSLAGRAETLRNLIAQVRAHLKTLTHTPVVETGRRSWGQMLGLPVQARYFRAYLPGPPPEPPPCPAGYELLAGDPRKDAPAISSLMNAAYPSLPELTNPAKLVARAHAVYDHPRGWLFLVHQDSGERVGLAISGYCSEMREGFIDWIQVVPRLRDHGLGRFLVAATIQRMPDEARFITAWGNLDAPFALGGLYADCGFLQIRQWTLLGQDPAYTGHEPPFLAMAPEVSGDV